MVKKVKTGSYIKNDSLKNVAFNNYFNLLFQNCKSDGIDAVIARASESGKHTVIGQHWYW
jgi:hypothetical protein